MLADMLCGGFDASVASMDDIIQNGSDDAATTVNLEGEEMEDGKASKKRRKKLSLLPRPRARSLEVADACEMHP
jgi:hypothetical protein